MPRPLWKGAISFGMVTIPIRLYSATEEKDVHFNMLHEKDHSRIKQKIFCAEEDVEVSRDETVKGYDLGGGNYVVIDDEDFDKVPVNTTRVVEITEFVNLEEIDPIYYQKTYYLEPEKVGAKPFALLMRALKDSGRIAVAKVSLRQKEQLCTLRIYKNTLALETMFYSDDVRSTADLEVPDAEEASDRELTMAKALVDMLSGDFDITAYHDSYRDALLEIIEKKSEGQVIAAPEPAPAPVTDLMEALRASVEAARQKKASATAKAEEEPAEEKPADIATERRSRRKAG